MTRLIFKQATHIRTAFLIALISGNWNCAGERLPPTRMASGAPCAVTVFYGPPPYAVEEIAPVTAACPGDYRFHCGIDEPGLLAMACNAGADTLFDVSETIGPSTGTTLVVTSTRMFHGHIGRRRIISAIKR